MRPYLPAIPLLLVAVAVLFFLHSIPATAPLVAGSAPVQAAQLGQLSAGIDGRIIFVKDANLWLWEGTGPRQLTQGENWRQPNLSPDGARIAYVYQSPFFSDVYTMSSRGGDFTRLTASQSSVLEENDWSLRPTWSPDGHVIAYATDSASYNPTLWLMNADGRNKRPLLSAAGGFRTAVDAFSWSPDGRHIAVAAFGEDEAQFSQIVSVDAQSGARTQLTKVEEGALDPAWSPDGRWIAFSRREGRRMTIQIMRADGSDVRAVSDQSPARSATWSPDGRLLAFLSAQDGTFEIWVVDVSLDGATPRVSSPRQLSRDLSIDATSGLSWAR